MANSKIIKFVLATPQQQWQIVKILEWEAWSMQDKVHRETLQTQAPDSQFMKYQKTDSERAVSSDEEAFYKNFQWLLYEKRFVVIIPARAKLDASLAFEEPLIYINW